MKLATIVLAAGQGTRMKSSLPKVLHPVCGRPMLFFPLHVAFEMESLQTLVVLGHESAQVKAALPALTEGRPVDVVIQKEQSGTGHAVMQALPLVHQDIDHLLILCGDTPLLQRSTLHPFDSGTHERKLAFLSAVVPQPTGYGRVVRDRQTGLPSRIVEEQDCTEAERSIQEINAGVYLVQHTFLKQTLPLLNRNNAKGEIYLTDLVHHAYAAGSVVALQTGFDQVRGVNTRIDLAKATKQMRKRINQSHMEQGVTFSDPKRTYVDLGVRIGQDTCIDPGVMLQGHTTIGQGCLIGAGSLLNNVTVGDHCIIKPYTVAAESVFESGVQVGPFSHIRPETYLSTQVRIGNFVELKKTTIGKYSKASHLSYLGDAEIGEHVNIGCGTITCNYDGFTKHKTVIQDGAFIGSDTQLVAPVTVGQDATVAAGTTVVHDVPAGSLALSRTQQTHVLGYHQKKQAKRAKEKSIQSDR